jgi:hypothetical protein
MGEFSGLSFRRGTTSPQIVGLPESTIASHGRWETLAYASYLHVHFSLQTRLAAAAQLQLSLYDSRLWARSRRFRQMEPHSVSYFLFPLAVQLPVHLVWWLLCLQWSVLLTTRTAELLSGLIANFSRLCVTRYVMLEHLCASITPLHPRSRAERRYEKE